MDVLVGRRKMKIDQRIRIHYYLVKHSIGCVQLSVSWGDRQIWLGGNSIRQYLLLSYIHQLCCYCTSIYTQMINAWEIFSISKPTDRQSFSNAQLSIAIYLLAHLPAVYLIICVSVGFRIDDRSWNDGYIMGYSPSERLPWV